MRYQTAQIRHFLRDYFNSEELKALLFDYFLPVYNRLTSGQDKDQQIQLLLDHCYRRGEVERLLDVLVEMRPTRFDRAEFVKTAEHPPAPPSQISVATEPSKTQTRIHPKTGKVMVFVPAGYFVYGIETLYEVY